MKIYTCYFAKMSSLPKDIIPIAICAKIPPKINIPQCKELAPTYKILMDYKTDNDKEKYEKEFSKILSNLNPNEIVDKFKQISNEKDVALICYEKPDSFCHRHLVARWLTNNGHIVQEYQF